MYSVFITICEKMNCFNPMKDLPRFECHVENRMCYCCEKKCFVQHGDQVDGLACTKCWSFGCCYCRCSTWVNEGHKKRAKKKIKKSAQL